MFSETTPYIDEDAHHQATVIRSNLVRDYDKQGHCVGSYPRKGKERESRLCSFIHLVVCLTTGPKLLPKRALHIVRSRASSFKWEYPLLSLRSSCSFLHLLPRLPVTSILPFIFPSITRCRRQFLCKMWPIQLAFLLLISCRIFLCSLTLSNTSSFSDLSSLKEFWHHIKNNV